MLAALAIASLLCACPAGKGARNQFGIPPDSGMGRVLDLDSFKPFDGQYPAGWPAEIVLPEDCYLPQGLISDWAPKDPGGKAIRIVALVKDPQGKLEPALIQQLQAAGWWVDLRSDAYGKEHWTGMASRRDRGPVDYGLDFGLNPNLGKKGLVMLRLDLRLFERGNR